MRSKQSGFSITEGIIAVVAIGILGFIGWTAYNNYGQPSKKMANATTNNTSTSPSKETTTAATVTTQGTYLDIKELGVKVLLNDQISDAVYAPYHNPSTNGSKIVGLSAQSLIDQQTDSKGYCAASGGAIGIILKTTTAPADLRGTLPVDNKTVFKFGNNYYWYRPPQNLGCSVGPITTDAVTNKINAFTQAFTTLQPDN